MTRTKPRRVSPATDDKPLSQRYGYQDRHRPPESAEHYSSSLTDAEWDLVQDLFEREDKRGVPAKIPRCTLVDACCYVVRTDCFLTGTTSTKPFLITHKTQLI